MSLIDEALSAEANTREQVQKARSHPRISPEVFPDGETA
jgi:hypothetical protein